MQSREEIESRFCWDLTALYETEQAFEKELKKQLELAGQVPPWKELAQFQEKLDTSSERIANFFDQYFSTLRTLDKIFTYAHLRHDENIIQPQSKKYFDQAHHVLHTFQSHFSWVEPLLLTLDAELLEDKSLDPYRHYLDTILRLKPYTLSMEQERLMGLSGKMAHTPSGVFSMLNNADLQFGEILDANQKSHKLSHALYAEYLHRNDRVLRERAFKRMHQTFGQFSNTITEVLKGAVENHIFNARARSYPSCLDAALYPHAIDKSVYQNLIHAVKNRLSVLHEYMDVRKEALGYEELMPHDLHVPLVSECDKKYSADEAAELVVASVAPLGNEYQETLRKGLQEQRWVDFFETENKRSGAYSSGCYDSHPYILMNFQGTLRDVFTLAHEAGHSMHSYLSREHQQYHNSHYPIFVAEVASTFNEELLLRYMLNNEDLEEKEKLYLINNKLDDMRATLFRQTQFAEFELLIHDLAEKGHPFIAEELKTRYLEINREYYGEALTLTEELGWEYLRIPHFYYNFYVYQYATGISAATALVEPVLQGDEVAKTRYLNFLSSGGSKDPIDLLELAGVDMRKPDAIDATIDHFHHLLLDFTQSFKKALL